MAQFEINSWVWIDHDEEKYLPAKVYNKQSHYNCHYYQY